MTRGELQTNQAWTARAALACALACALASHGCGGADKQAPPGIELKSLESKKKDKMPPLHADCAAAAAPAGFEPPTVTAEIGLRPPATEGATQLSAGPILGAVSDQSVAIWIRSDRPTPWRVAIWPDEQPEKKRVIDAPPTLQAHDFTATARVEELAPGTAYTYRVEVGAGPGALETPPRTFRTLPAKGTPSKLRFAVGGNIAGEADQPIFGQIADVKPDFMLLLGNLIYADKVKSNFEGFAKKYESNWNIAQLKALLQTVPAFMVWNDHEIKSNYYDGSSDKRYPAARLAYELYVQARNPAPARAGELHYTFQAGEVSFFVLDVRSHRWSSKLDDDHHKTMLGDEQKADLARFLKCAPGKIKVLVTPVAFSDKARGGDAWPAYKTERNQLTSFIEQERVDNLIVLSGDQSWAAVLVHNGKTSRFYEFQPTPLSKEIGKAPEGESKQIIARDDDHHVFGVVDIDTTVKPAAIAFTLCAKGKPCKPGEEPAPTTNLDLEGEQENTPFTVRITEDDLGPKADAPAPAEPPKAEAAGGGPAPEATKPAKTD